MKAALNLKTFRSKEIQMAWIILGLICVANVYIWFDEIETYIVNPIKKKFKVDEED